MCKAALLLMLISSFGLLSLTGCDNTDQEKPMTVKGKEAPRTQQAPKKDTNIKGPAGFELGTPLADIDTEGMISIKNDSRENSRIYLSESAYEMAGMSFPLQQVIICDSASRGEGKVTVYGLAGISESQVDEEELDLMLQVAEQMKRDLLEQFDASMITLDEERADFLVFELRDQEGNSVNVKVDDVGLRFRYRDEEATAWADSEMEQEPSNSDDAVLSQLDTPYDVKGLSITIHNFESRNTFGSKAKEGAKFAVVELTVTNTGQEEITFYPDDFIKLMDTKARRFEYFRDAPWDMKSYLRYRDLIPDIPERGILAFMVPTDSAGWEIVTVQD